MTTLRTSLTRGLAVAAVFGATAALAGCSAPVELSLGEAHAFSGEIDGTLGEAEFELSIDRVEANDAALSELTAIGGDLPEHAYFVHYTFTLLEGEVDVGTSRMIDADDVSANGSLTGMQLAWGVVNGCERIDFAPVTSGEPATGCLLVVGNDDDLEYVEYDGVRWGVE